MKFNFFRSLLAVIQISDLVTALPIKQGGNITSYAQVSADTSAETSTELEDYINDAWTN